MGLLSKLFGTDYQSQKNRIFAEFENKHGPNEINYVKAAWLSHRGRNLLESENYQQATLDFNEALTIDNNHISAFIGLSLAFCARGQFDDALNVLRNALASKDKSGECTILHQMISIYLAMEKWDEALDTAEKALEAFDQPERKESQKLMSMSKHNLPSDEDEIKETKELIKCLKKFIPCYKLASQGNPNAQYELGSMYECGFVVSQDMSKAIELWKKAADHGNVDAQFNLGNVYNNGLGTQVNHHTATEYFQKAATQGDAGAQYAMGLQFANGHGIQRDMVIASAWLKLASSHHSKYQNDAKEAYGMTTTHLNDEELREVDMLSNEWKTGCLIRKNK